MTLLLAGNERNGDAIESAQDEIEVVQLLPRHELHAEC
jgi:hypothetical protein